MSKKDYRVRNWREYNEALVQRGSITFWFDEETIKNWHVKKLEKSRGRPELYSRYAIQCALIIKSVFKLTLRGVEGFIRSVIKREGLALQTPDYTTLCKRRGGLEVDLSIGKLKNKEGLHIVIDSTGLKVFGEGEWKVRKHGYTKKRTWMKLHLAINSETQAIEASCLTKAGVQDCQALPGLLNEITSPIKKMVGDGAYDRFSCYEEAVKRGSEGIFPPQHNARTSSERPRNKKRASIEAIKRRDDTIIKVRELGLKCWKENVGYHRRSLAETGMFRIKTLLGSNLTARRIENQQVEVKIRCCVLNKLSTLGMPKTETI